MSSNLREEDILIVENAARNLNEYQRLVDPVTSSWKILATCGKIGIEVGGKSGKLAIEAVGKKIPIIGLVIGLGFGIKRIWTGEIKKGVLEMASGVASCFPGVGTVISIGADVVLSGHDIYKLNQ